MVLVDRYETGTELTVVRAGQLITSELQAVAITVEVE